MGHIGLGGFGLLQLFLVQDLIQVFHLHLLHPVDEEGVVAALPQLHLDIHQLGKISLEILHQESVVALEDGSVVLLLHGRQLHVYDGLFLRRDVLGHVFLHSPQEVWCDTTL